MPLKLSGQLPGISSTSIAAQTSPRAAPPFLDAHDIEPVRNEWPIYSGPSTCTFQDRLQDHVAELIRASGRIPGLGAVSSSSDVELAQLKPFHSLTPTEAKNNILRRRHLPLQPVYPRIRDQFDALLARHRSKKSDCTDDVPTPRGSTSSSSACPAHPSSSFFIAPYGTSSKANDREYAITERDGFASTTSSNEMVRSRAASPASDSTILTLSPTPSPESYRGRLVSGTSSTESDQSLGSLDMEWSSLAPSVDIVTLSTALSNSDCSLLDHLSLPPLAPAPQPSRLDNLEQIFTGFDMDWSLPALSIDTATPCTSRSESGFTMVEHPSSPSPTSTPAPAEPEMSEIFLSDLDDVEWTLPTSPINLEHHLDVGPNTRAYEPTGREICFFLVRGRDGADVSVRVTQPHTPLSELLHVFVSMYIYSRKMGSCMGN
ncbi:hypothetical protein DE146DRAFT_495707 [Phaeosphaeria sp. MPI-PUGE-AT-0046c]|nr:hypothetical protein DE146DRAFT_495707 [Phaeosphaeria sp. MPI-PUGE-AT-0046c]